MRLVLLSDPVHTDSFAAYNNSNSFLFIQRYSYAYSAFPRLKQP